MLTISYIIEGIRSDSLNTSCSVPSLSINDRTHRVIMNKTNNDKQDQPSTSVNVISKFMNDIEEKSEKDTKK